MRVFVLFVLVLMGCEEETVDQCVPNIEIQAKKLWIDETCSESMIELIVEASERVNDLSYDKICADTIEIAGILTVEDHDKKHGQVSTIVCYYDKVELNDTAIASTWKKEVIEEDHQIIEKGIDLYLWKLNLNDDVYIRMLIMHEMMHYIGVITHTEYGYHVMSPRLKHNSHPDRNWSDMDKDLFCEYFDCTN